MGHHLLPPETKSTTPTTVVSWLQALDTFVRRAEQDHAQQVALHVGQRLHDHLSRGMRGMGNVMDVQQKNGWVVKNGKPVKHPICGNMIHAINFL